MWRERVIQDGWREFACIGTFTYAFSVQGSGCVCECTCVCVYKCVCKLKKKSNRCDYLQVRVCNYSWVGIFFNVYGMQISQSIRHGGVAMGYRLNMHVHMRAR